MKKFILLAALMMMVSTAAATDISFSPDHWDIQKWCLIATDIFINTDGKPVAATDVVIETSLAYVDFVPSKKLFPNFFPPKVKNNAIHIVWFIDDPKKTITWSGSIGTLFLRQKNTTDTDWVVTLFFDWEGKTYDSNLSILWWIDVLQHVWSGYYHLVDTWSCVYPSGYNIVGWFSHMSPAEWLSSTMKQIQQKELMNKIINWRTLWIFMWLLIILVILYFYIKKWRHHLIKATS